MLYLVRGKTICCLELCIRTERERKKEREKKKDKSKEMKDRIEVAK